MFKRGLFPELFPGSFFLGLPSRERPFLGLVSRLLLRVIPLLSTPSLFWVIFTAGRDTDSRHMMSLETLLGPMLNILLLNWLSTITCTIESTWMQPWSGEVNCELMEGSGDGSLRKHQTPIHWGGGEEWEREDTTNPKFIWNQWRIRTCTSIYNLNCTWWNDLSNSTL